MTEQQEIETMEEIMQIASMMSREKLERLISAIKRYETEESQ